MKKIAFLLVVIIAMLVLTSCHDEAQSNVRVINDTIYVAYAEVTHDGSSEILELEPKEIKRMGFDFTEAYSIKPTDSDGLEDKALYIAKDGRFAYIRLLEHCSYSFKVLVPASAFDGSEALYLAERGNRIERFPSGLTTKKIDADGFFSITSYGRDFYLCDAEGKEKSTLNGCPIAMRQEGSTYLIY